jgi:hypothetical protein
MSERRSIRAGHPVFAAVYSWMAGASPVARTPCTGRGAGSARAAIPTATPPPPGPGSPCRAWASFANWFTG